MNLIDIQRTFHPKIAEYTIFSSTHGTLTSTDHMLSPKASPSKSKKPEMLSILLMLWDYKSNTKKKKASENTDNVETKQYVTKQTNRSLDKSKEKFKNKNKNLEANENNSKSIRLRKISSKREVYSNKAYLRKQEKSQINNLNFPPKRTRKRKIVVV